MRRRNSLALALVLVLMLAAVAMGALAIAGKQPSELSDWLFAQPEDGAWMATSFDDLPVTPNNYLISIRRGKIVGGYDDCNGWSYQDVSADPRGERMIVSTLQECPENQLDRTYWVLVRAPQIHLYSQNRLRLSREGHSGDFTRCEQDRRTQRCLPLP